MLNIETVMGKSYFTTHSHTHTHTHTHTHIHKQYSVPWFAHLWNTCVTHATQPSHNQHGKPSRIAAVQCLCDMVSHILPFYTLDTLMYVVGC
jgi:hypothetical protein